MNSDGALLKMRNTVKSSPGVRALDDASLVARPGECVGLCGENGAGKSAPTKVLSGVYPCGTFEGEILWEGEPLRTHFVCDSEYADTIIVCQELMMVQQLSVTENIFLSNEIAKSGSRMDYDAMYARAEELLARLRLTDVSVAAPVMNCGNGRRQLFEIAKALAKNARLLILDEPTSSLSVKGVEVLLPTIDDLKRSDVTCVYISHKLDEAKRVCDTVTVTRDDEHTGTRLAVDMTIDNIITVMVGRKMVSPFPKVEYTVGDVIIKTRSVTY